MVTDIMLLAFKAISSFIKDIAEEYGDSIHSVKLYNHLLTKTTLQHTKAIEKHYNLFKEFCVTNRNAIEKTSVDDLQSTYIEYSENIKVDISEIFKQATKQNTEIIWKHILTISAIVDQSGEARRVLKELSSNKEGAINENDFLTDLLDKIETVVDPNADPMSSISSLMSSGVFTDIITGMGNGLQDGSLDLNKLMGSVQGLVTKMNPPGDGSSTDGGTPPVDMSGMLNMLGPMLNQAGNTDSIPQSIKALKMSNDTIKTEKK